MSGITKWLRYGNHHTQEEILQYGSIHLLYSSKPIRERFKLVSISSNILQVEYQMVVLSDTDL